VSYVRLCWLTSALVAWCSAQAVAQTPWACPKEVPAGARCFQDRDENGAYVLAAVPKNWSGVLVVHSHGGPRTAPLDRKANDEDLSRFAFFVGEGHAWVNSSYRRPGFGVAMAVEDTESARRHFLDKIVPLVGKPRLVVAHGQSWGGNVTAKLIEMDARRAQPDRAFAGALLTSAVLPGGARGYWFRADLRAVYEFYCKNHPRPDEPQYLIALGLPRDARMSQSELRTRVNACTGLNKPVTERTPEQARNLANILGVVKIVEPSLMGHLGWATHLFQDLTQERFGGNPFSNIGVIYSGSSDDAALNAGVIRFASEPSALAAMDKDGQVTGAFDIPVVTMHATRDPTAFVENESAYRAIVEAAGRGDRLVQVFVDEAVHSRLLTPHYPAAFDALLAWIEKGRKPTASSIAQSCEALSRTYNKPCRFVVDFKPAPYESRVPDRKP
jgi:alpha-beta hydrolase superfamily lysophospholipase